MKKGLYAGSFDPITKGHLDIISQSLKIFDYVEIAIGANPQKNRMIPIDKAKTLIAMSLEDAGIDLSRTQTIITDISGAIALYAEKHNFDGIIRGLRQVSDFDSEFRLHGVNSRVTEIPMTYFICKSDFLHVSSSTVKEAHSLGLDISWLVTDSVKRYMNDTSSIF